MIQASHPHFHEEFLAGELRRWAWVWLLLLASLSPCAPVLAEIRENDIHAVEERLTQYPVIHGTFSQRKRLSGFDYDLESNGRFIFWQGRGLYLETQQPFFTAMTLSADQVFYWDKDGKATRASESSGLVQREINRTLLAFLGADITQIEQRFEIDWESRPASWTATLSPRRETTAAHIRSVRLKGTDFLESLYFETPNGDVIELTFSLAGQASSPTLEQCLRFFVDDVTCRAMDP